MPSVSKKLVTNPMRQLQRRRHHRFVMTMFAGLPLLLRSRAPRDEVEQRDDDQGRDENQFGIHGSGEDIRDQGSGIRDQGSGTGGRDRQQNAGTPDSCESRASQSLIPDPCIPTPRSCSRSSHTPTCGLPCTCCSRTAGRRGTRGLPCRSAFRSSASPAHRTDPADLPFLFVLLVRLGLLLRLLRERGHDAQAERGGEQR